jgi:RimJ/RimL family protein N-acetyltransferase
MMMKLKQHEITLAGDRVVLRPMIESDWPSLLEWNSDAEVLYFSEGADVAAYSLEDIQGIYRGVSQSAFCFIIELNSQPAGECWLQRMNLDRILAKRPGQDCRRIDLMIGEKQLWGRGLGTDVIRTLSRFGFEQEQADMIFGCGIADYNPRSLRAFQKAGYQFDAKVPEKPGMKAEFVYDVVLTREEYYSRVKET